MLEQHYISKLEDFFFITAVTMKSEANLAVFRYQSKFEIPVKKE
jgi:hypothetical protein